MATVARFYDLYPWNWIAIGVLFVIFEFTPLALGKPQYTLSDYIWRLEEINARWTALRYFIVALCVFLVLHLGFGWLR